MLRRKEIFVPVYGDLLIVILM
jgi:hypothetical protein